MIIYVSVYVSDMSWHMVYKNKEKQHKLKINYEALFKMSWKTWNSGHLVISELEWQGWKAKDFEGNAYQITNGKHGVPYKKLKEGNSIFAI